MEVLVGILSASSSAAPAGVTGAALQQVSEPAYRAVVALGTLITGLESEEIQMAASSIYDVGALMTTMEHGVGNEERFRPVIQEIRAALKAAV